MKIRNDVQRPDTQTLYERLFASSPDAIVVADGEGRILEGNPQVETLFGYSCSELLGSPIEMLIPERFRRVHAKHRAEYNHKPRMRAMGVGSSRERKVRLGFDLEASVAGSATARESFSLQMVRRLGSVQISISVFSNGAASVLSAILSSNIKKPQLSGRKMADWACCQSSSSCPGSNLRLSEIS